MRDLETYVDREWKPLCEEMADHVTLKKQVVKNIRQQIYFYLRIITSDMLDAKDQAVIDGMKEMVGEIVRDITTIKFHAFVNITEKTLKIYMEHWRMEADWKANRTLSQIRSYECPEMDPNSVEIDVEKSVCEKFEKEIGVDEFHLTKRWSFVTWEMHYVISPQW